MYLQYLQEKDWFTRNSNHQKYILVSVRCCVIDQRQLRSLRLLILAPKVLDAKCSI